MDDDPDDWGTVEYNDGLGTIDGSGAPGYVEAYPVIRIIDLQLLTKDPLLMEWFSFNNGPLHKVGSATLEIATSEAARITWSFERFYGFDQSGGKELLQVREVRAGFDRRQAILCMVRGCPSQRLFFVNGEWGCQHCNGLQSRSALMPRRARWAEERSELNRELKYGRPAGMRIDVYRRKLDRLRQLIDRVGMIYPNVPAQFARRMFSSAQIAEWRN